MSLPNLHAPGCTKCKLSACRQNIVNNVLPASATIIILNESPGEAEDVKGSRPLIGSAGRLLEECIRRAGLDINRDNIALLNLVKCRPVETNQNRLDAGFKNRPPSATELKACSEYINQEIKSITGRKVILALGAGVLKWLYGKNSLKFDKVRGELLNHTDYGNIIVTHHPAKLMHAKDAREKAHLSAQIVEDIRKVKAIAGNDVTALQTTQHYIIRKVNQVDWLVNQLEASKIFTFDIETSSLDHLQSTLLCYSFSWKKGVAAVLPLVGQHCRSLWSPEDYDYIQTQLKRIFENPNTKKVAHNGKFDIQHIKHQGIEVSNFYADTMIMHYLIDENTAHDLKSLSCVYTDVGGYESELDDLRKAIAKDTAISLKKLSYATLPEDKLWKYAGMDADVTFRLLYTLWPLLEKEGLTPILRELYIPFLRILINAEYTGVKIDTEYLDNVINIYDQKISELNTKIQLDNNVRNYATNKETAAIKAITDKWVNSKTLTKRYDLSDYIIKNLEDVVFFNPDSPKQLTELFIQQMKLPIVSTTASGQPSMDAESLAFYAKKVPLAKLLLQKSKLSTLYGTFLAGMRDKVRSDGRLHTSFNMHVAVTGRLSSSAPNLQNVPNFTNNPEDAKLIRNQFIAEEGCSLLEVDYAQAEFRILGMLSGDPILKQDLIDGLDVHRLFASRGFGIPEEQVTKQQRGASKQVVFGTMYGRQPKSVAEQLDIPIEQAESIQQSFFDRYRVSANWITKTKAEAKKFKQVKGLFGQIRHLSGQIDSYNHIIRSEAERQCVNSPIQGSASQMNCYASIRINQRIQDFGIDAQMLMWIHDAIVFNVADDQIELLKEVITDCMLHPHDIVGDFPLGVDFKVGKRWGDMVGD